MLWKRVQSSDENVQDVYNLICELKQQYPDKKIWMYTGYTWEQIMASNNVRKWTVLSVDVLAEGLFRLDLQDINNKQIKWVGSLNQRVIDVKQSVSTNQIVLFQD